MLHPMDNDDDLTIYMEYIGLANTPGSPCAGPGIPGGPAAPDRSCRDLFSRGWR